MLLSWPTMNALKLHRSERLRLFVKEAGSAPLTGGGSDAFDETLVVAQMQEETPAGFAQRVIERIAAVERSGRCFGAARVQTGDLQRQKAPPAPSSGVVWRAPKRCGTP